MICAADHVGDAHLDVIHNSAELVGGKSQAIRPFRRSQKHEIFDLVVVHLACTKNDVFKLGPRSEWHPKANRRCLLARRRLTIAAIAADHAPWSRTLLFPCLLGSFPSSSGSASSAGSSPPYFSGGQ